MADSSTSHFDVTRGDQPVFTGYLGGLLAIAGPLTISRFVAASEGHLFRWALFIWLCLLGLFLVIIDYWAQKRWGNLPPLSQRPALTWREVFPKAVARWLSWIGILALARLALFLFHSYQDNWFSPFRMCFDYACLFWLVAGVPYYLFTLRKRSGLGWDRRDVSVLFLALVRKTFRVFVERRIKWGKAHVLWNGRLASRIWLGLGVKAFFLPLMTTFFFKNSKETVELFQTFLLDLNSSGTWDQNFYGTCYHLYRLLFSGIFMIDVTVVTLGYALTLRWLDNGIKSAEPTAFGWLVCTLCYKPVQELARWYLLWPEQTLKTLPDGVGKLVLMIAVILLLSIYVWATLAFGLRFSNLTNRGIITQGPYRYVRHPAYISKNLAWWLQHLPAFFASPMMTFYMLAWNLIYLLRAWTEERHLSQDPKYRAYKSYVRWRIIPGLF